jgi:hypothetical protein
VQNARADMMYSEFISSEGLIRDAIKSRMKLDILITNARGIQILVAMKRQWLCLKIVSTVNPDIDINFDALSKKSSLQRCWAGVLKMLT